MATKKKAEKKRKRFVLTIEVEGGDLTVKELRKLESIGSPEFLIYREEAAEGAARIVQVQVNRVRD